MRMNIWGHNGRIRPLYYVFGPCKYILNVKIAVSTRFNFLILDIDGYSSKNVTYYHHLQLTVVLMKNEKLVFHYMKNFLETLYRQIQPKITQTLSFSAKIVVF